MELQWGPMQSSLSWLAVFIPRFAGSSLTGICLELYCTVTVSLHVHGCLASALRQAACTIDSQALVTDCL